MNSQLEVFDATKLATTLRCLSIWKRVAFMTYCCERMFPNYQRFSVETEFGDARVLRRALDVAWEWIQTSKSANDISALSYQCGRLAPNTETFTSRYTSAALDATSAVAVLLESTKAFQENQPVEVASLARDTVDLFVQEDLKLDPKDPGFEGKILKHSLMQAELRCQRTSIDVLAHLPEDRTVSAGRLYLEWANLSRGSLDNELA